MVSDTDRIYPIPSIFLSISPSTVSIFEEANHLFPGSFSESNRGQTFILDSLMYSVRNEGPVGLSL
jgi:hypothetical protein